MKRENKSLRELLGAVALALLVAAVVRELSIPRDQRTWHGSILGVPYDLRRPSWGRVRESWWAPQDPRLVTPRVLGVGWSLNVGRISALVKARFCDDRSDLS